MASTPGLSPTIAARLDRLPECGYFYRLIALLSVGGCFEFYDIFFTAYIAPALYKSHLFTPTTNGFFDLSGFASFAAALFAGLWIGTLFLGRLSDRFGRRTVFMAALLWYSAGTFIMAFQQTAAMIVLWRFIASIGIGVELVTLDTYIAELVPKTMRGKAFALSQFITFAAVPVVAFLAWWLGPATILGLDGWRWVVIIGSSGAIVVWLILRLVPESPRWLEKHGDTAHAGRVVSAMEAKVAAAIRGPLPDPVVLEGEAQPRPGRLSDLMRAPLRRRTIMMVVFNLFQTVGYYGFASWVPTFLMAQGVGAAKSLQYSFIIAIAQPFGPLIGFVFADRLERKWQISLTAVLVAGLGLLFAHQHATGGVIACGVGLTLANTWMSFAYHAYQAELFPTDIRGKAVGFVYSFSRLSAIFSSYLIAFFLKQYGAPGVFVFIALCMGGIVASVGGFGPRTNRLRLEEIGGPRKAGEGV